MTLTHEQVYQRAYHADYRLGIRRPVVHGVCECGTKFSGNHPNQRYCGHSCKQIAAKMRRVST